MPSSIPYDHPSLALGNVIDPALLAKLKQLGKMQSTIEAAQDKMNSYITLKRSLDMTINELQAMNIDTSDLAARIREVDKSIADAAVDYSTVRVKNELEMQHVKEEVAGMNIMENVESPVDFENTIIRNFPLSADSIKLDAQYFSYDGNNPSGSQDSIEQYIRDSTGDLGARASNDIAKAASSQIGLQRKNHALSGTLIITANCTHKQSVLLSPCVIDADKSVAVWNRLYSSDNIDTSEEKLKELATTNDEPGGPMLSIISGASYGSSFVGMVHILKQDEAGSAQASSLTALAGNLQERLTVGSWLEEAAGGFGIDQAFTDDIRNLLHAQKITAHITVVVMGCIPSIRSNQLQMGIKTFLDADQRNSALSLPSITNATSSEKKTVSQAANAAKTGAQMLAMQNATLQGVMSGLGKIDQSANKLLDINAMMTAFEDYLEEVKNGRSGIPLNFYLKNLSRQQVAKLCLDKYYPEKNTTGTADKEEGNKEEEAD